MAQGTVRGGMRMTFHRYLEPNPRLTSPDEGSYTFVVAAGSPIFPIFLFEAEMTRRLNLCTWGLLALLASTTSATAGVVHDETNASSAFSGAFPPEVVGAGVDVIRGTIGGSDEGDLYRVFFPTDGVLTLEAVKTSGALDPALFLFDSKGRGILSNAALVLNQTFLNLTITAGIYYIGMGDYPLQAIDTLGNTWDAVVATPLGPPAAFDMLERLRNTDRLISPGNYRIHLSMETGDIPVAVPEPGVLALLSIGLAVIGFRRSSARWEFAPEQE
ncbi:MAG: PEP-CTERM sorting domain-containing protein [Candidatus Accumulibacter phosphatis]|nr:PEP-CTERM sorting domain-containing protein [Candidatus Accumulibacter phosphatis]